MLFGQAVNSVGQQSRSRIFWGKAVMVRAIIAFLASVFVGAQTYFMYIGEKGICFNDGCEIVDSLTRISPLYFNIAGLILFQTLFWLFLLGRGDSEFWHKIARLLLLAALAAEAVLIYFQHMVAGDFCSYCLVVFALILLLNLLCGPRQMFRGVVIFSAVMISAYSLRFGSPTAGGSGQPLDAGSIAAAEGDPGRPQLHLFFSAACPHCEKVIEGLREENLCSIRFNPVEELVGFSFPGAKIFDQYQPEINLALLKTLSISEIPVLVAAEAGTTTLLRGEGRIGQYLDEKCRRARPQPDLRGSSQLSSPSGYGFTLPQLPATEDACTVVTGCAEEEGGGSSSTQQP
jgi:uncharacterized membrane protein